MTLAPDNSERPGECVMSIPLWAAEAGVQNIRAIADASESFHGHTQFSLYANSSDPSTILDGIDVSGEHVVTVGGSGECAPFFVARGAKSVEVCDTSLLACCWSELKHAGLKIFSFDEFRTAFHDFKRDDTAFRLIDADLYKRLRPHVSPTTRYVVDALQEPSGTLADFSIVRDRDRHARSTFVYLRKSSIPTDPYPSYIGGSSFGIHSPELYQDLRTKMSNVPLDISLWDIADACGQQRIKPDTVFISNAGFSEDQSCAIARALVQKGAKRVLFTAQWWDYRNMLINREDCFFPEEIADRFDLVEELRSGSQWKGVEWPVLNEMFLLPGRTYLMEGLPVRLIGHDQRFTVPMLFEHTAELTRSPAVDLEQLRTIVKQSVARGFAI